MSIGLSEVDHRRDIIIARNLLTPPALLLGKKVVPDAASLLDFCTLINALMLHDRLVTFHAQCPDEILDLSLYRYLKEEGILVELDTSSIHRNELTIQWITQFVDKKATDEDLEKALGKNYSFNEYIKDNKFVPDGNHEIHLQRRKYIEEIISNKISRISLKESSLNDLQSYRLRTAGYLAVANETATPFLPDFMRIPTMRDFDSKLIEHTRIAINNPSVRMAINDKIYETLRQEMGTKIRKKTGITPLSKIVSLPSGVSSFIDEYASNSNLGQAFYNMRSRFKGLRKRLIDLENRLYMAQSRNDIEEMNKVEEEIKELTDSQGEGTNYRGQIIWQIFPIIYGLITSIIDPGPPPRELASASINVIKTAHNWNRRRKRNHVVSGNRETPIIKDQRSQFEKAFGNPLPPDEIVRFTRLTSSLDRLSKNAQSIQ